jgi:hypothetical protein
MKVLFTTLAFITSILTSQSLLAQSSNRFSDWQVSELNKAMKERAVAEAKAVPQARPISQLNESKKTPPESPDGARKDISR